MPDSFAAELAALDATAQADLVRRGDLRPVNLVEAAIQRIEALNPRLNAVITSLYDKALAAARDPALLDRPFRGVPLLLKDYLCETVGDPYYEGMHFLRDRNWHSTADTHLATRFRAAGFIFLGKTTAGTGRRPHQGARKLTARMTTQITTPNSTQKELHSLCFSCGTARQTQLSEWPNTLYRPRR